MGELGSDLVGNWHLAVHAAIKAATLFLMAAVAFRFALRRTLAQFAPFDWVVAVAVGAIIGRTATATDATWLSGTAALLALLAAHALFTWLRLLPGVQSWIDPPLRILIRNGEIDHRNLRRSGMVLADLQALLRENGLPSVADVHLAVLESRGTVSFVTHSVELP